MRKFIMLVGPAGSGKSTVAEKLHEEDNYVIVSSDAVRYELFGDESIQGNPAEIFSICRVRCANLLNTGHDVVFDATNLNRKKRKGFLTEVANKVKDPFEKYCVVVAITYEDCCYQNSQRQRSVPEYVIRRHFDQFQMPLFTEGWDRISFVQRSHVNIDELLERCKAVEHDNKHHKYNVYDHIMKTSEWITNNVSKEDYQKFLVLQHFSLWHDVGKLYTKVFEDKKGNPTEEAHFYSHEAWSCMYCLCEDFYDPMFKILIAQLVSLHMMKYQPEYSRFVEKWVPEYKHILDIFNEADRESA